MDDNVAGPIGAIIFIVFAIVFCILVGAFWRSKGRSFAAGFFLSLLLSPIIGFIIGLIVRANPRRLEASALARGEMKKCPFCAELVKNEASVCKHCGKEIR